MEILELRPTGKGYLGVAQDSEKNMVRKSVEHPLPRRGRVRFIQMARVMF